MPPDRLVASRPAPGLQRIRVSQHPTRSHADRDDPRHDHHPPRLVCPTHRTAAPGHHHGLVAVIAWSNTYQTRSIAPGSGKLASSTSREVSPVTTQFRSVVPSRSRHGRHTAIEFRGPTSRPSSTRRLSSWSAPRPRRLASRTPSHRRCLTGSRVEHDLVVTPRGSPLVPGRPA
jgi:hypothetical protein